MDEGGIKGDKNVEKSNVITMKTAVIYV